MWHVSKLLALGAVLGNQAFIRVAQIRRGQNRILKYSPFEVYSSCCN